MGHFLRRLLMINTLISQIRKRQQFSPEYFRKTHRKISGFKFFLQYSAFQSQPNELAIDVDQVGIVVNEHHSRVIKTLQRFRNLICVPDIILITKRDYGAST